MTTFLAWGGIASAVVIIVSALRLLGPVRRRIRSFFERMERANDVVLGSPAIPDPDRPGQVLRPAIPDIGVRMTASEEAQRTTQALLTEFVVGAVEEAKHAAGTAARAALKAQAAADEARTFAAESAGRFTELSGQVTEMSIQITAWQETDRSRADAATAVLHEVVRAIPPPPGEKVS